MVVAVENLAVSLSVEYLLALKLKCFVSDVTHVVTVFFETGKLNTPVNLSCQVIPPTTTLFTPTSGGEGVLTLIFMK
jgi:hypothetical protein